MCKSFLENFVHSESFLDNVFIANSSNNPEIKEKAIDNIRKSIVEKCVDGKDLFNLDTHFNIREIVVLGRNNWFASAVNRKKQNN